MKPLSKMSFYLRVLCGTSHAEEHVPVRGSAKRAPCGLRDRLPDAHVTAADFWGATVDMPEVLLRTRAKAAAGGEHNREEKGIALIVLNIRGRPTATQCDHYK